MAEAMSELIFLIRSRTLSFETLSKDLIEPSIVAKSGKAVLAPGLPAMKLHIVKTVFVRLSLLRDMIEWRAE